jgi:hypothetical protein
MKAMREFETVPTASGAALESLVRNAKTWLARGNGFALGDARHE